MDIIGRWFDVVDSWFAITTMIGVVVLVVVVVGNIIRAIFGRDSNSRT